MRDSLGVYISVPFCKAKCTYCNFASGVFGAERMDAYVERVCAEMRGVRAVVAGMGGDVELVGFEIPGRVDSIYLGGGTPSLLSAEQAGRLFAALRGEFAVSADAEITLECAPGQIGDETLEAMLRAGVNRVSFGVQSFVDAETTAVGRLHTRAVCLDEIARLRSAGVKNINVDLIAGLPGQTHASWCESVEVALESAVPHVSVYMLEVDEDSRLGREMLAQGMRYGAADTPTEDESAEWYGEACEWLEAAGIAQYEISNFAREGGGAEDLRSRHNMRYWRRGPYVGFGLDAHSMLRTGVGGVRWANGDELNEYIAGDRRDPLRLLAMRPEAERIGREEAFEETMFLGLRMNEGVDLEALRAEFGEGLLAGAMDAVAEVEEAGLIEREGARLRLTARGRMVSNEVFSRLLVAVT